jgi:hypothetical protein
LKAKNKDTLQEARKKRNLFKHARGISSFVRGASTQEEEGPAELLLSITEQLEKTLLLVHMPKEEIAKKPQAMQQVVNHWSCSCGGFRGERNSSVVSTTKQNQNKEQEDLEESGESRKRKKIYQKPRGQAM